MNGTTDSVWLTVTGQDVINYKRSRRIYNSTLLPDSTLSLQLQHSFFVQPHSLFCP